MTTDLTGDFELGEDEFDWDVFLPDPDEAEIDAVAAALDDEAELNLDDSDFDWERAVREDSEPESEADSGARAGAAYDRIVDTMRPAVEEPEADTQPVPVVLHDSETLTAAEPEPEAFGMAVASAAALERDDEPAPTLERTPDPRWTPEREPAAAFLPEPDLEAETDDVLVEELEPDSWLDMEQEQDSLSGSDPEQFVTFEPEKEAQPVATHFAEAPATLGVVGAMESVPAPPPEPELAWAMAPAAPWEVEGATESASDPDRAATADEGKGKQKKSRVFKAVVVLACVFLVVGAAAVAVRKLHHPTATATPPAHVTTPTASATASSGAGASAAGTARIQAATDSVNSATTAANVGITSLATFPTPINVETVINPYISSLQLYETFLAGTTVPAAARPAAASAEAQLRQDLTFLDTIDGLPAQQLGAFLVQFDTDTTHLQTTLSTLQQKLGATAS